MLTGLEGAATPPAGRHSSPPRPWAPGRAGGQSGFLATPSPVLSPLWSWVSVLPRASTPTAVPHVGLPAASPDPCGLCPPHVPSAGKSPRHLRPTQPNPRLCLRGPHSGHLPHLSNPVLSTVMTSARPLPWVSSTGILCSPPREPRTGSHLGYSRCLQTAPGRGAEMDKETISIQMNSYEEGSIGQAVTQGQRNFKHLRLQEGFLEEGMLEWNPDTRIKFCFQSGLCWLCLDQPKWVVTKFMPVGGAPGNIPRVSRDPFPHW